LYRFVDDLFYSDFQISRVCGIAQGTSNVGVRGVGSRVDAGLVGLVERIGARLVMRPEMFFNVGVEPPPGGERSVEVIPKCLQSAPVGL